MRCHNEKGFALILTVMLLSACAPKDDTQPIGADTQATMEASDITTAPATTEAPTEEKTEAWYVQSVSPAVAYEELNTKDLPYSGARWLTSGEQGATVFEIQVNGGTLEVRDVLSFGDPVYTVALPANLS